MSKLPRENGEDFSMSMTQEKIEFGFYSELIEYLNTEKTQDRIVNGAQITIQVRYNGDEPYYRLLITETRITT
jgi:hypothetical protein